MKENNETTVYMEYMLAYAIMGAVTGLTLGCSYELYAHDTYFDQLSNGQLVTFGVLGGIFGVLFGHQAHRADSAENTIRNSRIY
ncbi:MAG: hypothetical protein NBV63_03420 [Candidatus Pacebacteria bacterium]|nr:hypothetical protein [Candidatus Paceibacterota bacterium]